MRSAVEGSATKKRVLFVRRTTSYGGSEAVILDLLRGIDYQKNIVYVSSPVDVFSDTMKRNGTPAQWVPLTASCTGTFFFVLSSYLHFFRSLAPRQVVLAQGGFEDFPLPVVLAAFLATHGKVYIAELHPAPKPPARSSKLHFGFLPGIGLWWYGKILPQRARAFLAKRILAVSQGVKTRLFEDYGYPLKKIDVVYNGVDTVMFSEALGPIKLALRKQFGVPEDAVVVVSAARLHPLKRLDRLIKAFAALNAQYHALWLLFTGDGPAMEELKKMAASVSGATQIRFLGHVENVADVMRASDIFVLPSEEEGFGIALAEAMACKLICVSTSTTGPREIIEDCRNGFLVETSDEGVARGLRAALSLHPREREMMKARARQTVVDKFSLDRAVREALALLNIESSVAVAEHR